MGKTPSDLSNKLLTDRPLTDDNIKHLAKDINQAFLCPQQAFSPIPNDYHVSTSGYEAPTISLEQCFKWLNAVAASKAGGPDDIPNWVLRQFVRF